MGKSRMRSLFKKLRKDEESESPLPQRDPATPPSNSVANVSIPSANSGTSQAPLPVEPFQSQDLWMIAFDKLDAEQQAILSEVKPQTKSRDQQGPIETNNVVDEVVDLTTERYRQFQIKASGRFHKSSRKILDAALSFKEVIEAAAGLYHMQHAASVWAMVSLGLKVWLHSRNHLNFTKGTTFIPDDRNYHDRQDALFESTDYLADTLAQCAFIEQKYYRTPNSFDPENVGDALVRLYLALLRYTVQVQRELAASRAKRLWDCVSAMVDIPLTELKASIEHELEGLDRRIVRDQHLKRGEQAEMILSEIEKLVEYLKQFTEQLAIANLPIAKTASYDSYANQNEDFCLQGTREELLRDIFQWAESRDEFMFCLKGMAGTGKSTVARTIARDLQRRGLLGATFFFKRGDADRGDGRLFMSTIARLLAARFPEISPGILEAVQKDDQIGSRHLGEQFDKLLYQPLLGFRPEAHPTTVIIIDALDECDKKDDIIVILNHLFRLQKIRTLRLRIFLTTRPEFDIQRVLSRNSNRRDIVLNELPLPVIEHDIELFLTYKFSVIRDEESLDAEWPGNDQLERLVHMATPLFIFAATICRFISDPKFDPEQRLREFLDQPATASEDQMDRKYLPVLNQLVVGYSTRDAEKQRRRFLETVGVIILLVDPLSLTALSHLINMPAKEVDRGLRCFHSVLAVPTDYTTPICTLHTSFRDFLITTDSDFHVNEEKTHGRIASHCLRVMMSGLKHNICGLASYGTDLRDIDQQTIDQHLNAELQYACRYWVHHLQSSKDQVSESDILSFLEEHFLHWLEALALMRRLSEAIGMIEILKSATTMYVGSKLPRFLEDAERFNFYTTLVAGTAPLQLYSYGLVFAPSESIVKQTFLKKEIAPHIKSFSEVDKTWGANRQTLDGHEDIVISFAFSPSGETLASMSFDNTIKIWDMATGTRKQTLFHIDPNGFCDHMTFCDDGNTLITGTRKTLIHWDLPLGTPRKTLTCHSSFERNITACNGHTLAISSKKGDIEIIDADTGIPRQTFNGHSHAISALAFSPDGLILASGSRDTTIKIWDAVKCILLKTLTGHSSYIRSLIFSPNGLCLASSGKSTAASESIKLWDAYHGTLQNTLQLDTDEVKSMAFSPDGRTLAFDSEGCTIKFWDTTESTKAHLLRFEFMAENATAVLFSPNGQTLVSGHLDGIMILWNTYGNGNQSKTGERSCAISSVNFSPDGNILLSASFDRTVGLWDTKEGDLRKTIKHSDYHRTVIEAVAMSPDGLRIASFDDYGIIWIWDTSTGKLQHEIDVTRGFFNHVSLVFSPDGRFLASSYRLTPVVRAEGSRTIVRADGNRTIVEAEAYETAVGMKINRNIKLWDTTSYQNVQTFEGPFEASPIARTVTFSPDGQMVALLFEERIKNIIELHETATGMLKGTFLYPVPLYGRISSLEFSHDGKGLELSFTAEPACLYQPLGEDCGSSSLGLTKTPKTPLRLSVSGRWITLGGENVLLVPVEYGSIGYRFVVKGSMIAFGLRNGRTSIIEFNVEDVKSEEKHVSC